MKLGLVTYNLAKDWDLATIIDRCAATGFQGVELRTTHAHGVEPSLDRAARRRVREQFAGSPVTLVGLGTTCEFHATDPAVVQKNVEIAKAFIELAADVGAGGIKVRPNGHQEAQGIPRRQTLEQIGRALNECAAYAERFGVDVRMEMHGAVAAPADITVILRVADHPRARACWNSNPVDVQNGSIRAGFELIRPWLGLVHVNELHLNVGGAYPYGELFHLLRETGYDGFCLAEVPASPEPERFMRYYRALFEALGGV